MTHSGCFAIVLLASAWAAPSSLQAAEPSLWQESRQLDGNADGTMSLDEYQTGVESKFRAMDTDEDGFVTVDELDGVRLDMADPDQTPSADRIAPMDVDKDGKLSETEHQNSARDRFNQADVSKDGNLDNEEMKTAAAGNPA